MPKPTYALRNALLLKMGFSSYNAYLSSELWAEIRIIIFERDNNCCKLCNLPAYAVHHLDYSEATLRGETFDGLVSICKKCHDKVEFTKNGKKRTLLQAVVRYKSLERLRKKATKPSPRYCKVCKTNRVRKNYSNCRRCIRERRNGEKK